MRKRLLAIIATAAMVVTMIPSMVFANTVVEVDSYDDLVSALQNGNDVKLVDDLTVDTWVKIVLHSKHPGAFKMENVTIDGNGKTITVAKVESAGNGDYVFGLNGGCVAKNITFDFTSVNGDDVAAAFSTTGDNYFSNITIKGNGTNNGIIVGEGTTTVESCTFDNLYYGVYADTPGEVTIIKDNTFKACAYATIIEGDNSVFDKNSVDSGKVTVQAKGEITNNTFTGNTRVKFYYPESAKTFKDNNFKEDSWIAVEEGTNGDVFEVPGIEQNTYEDPQTALEYLGDEELIDEISKAAAEYTASKNANANPAPSTPDKSPATGDNSALPFAVAGIALAAMAAVVATRRRTN